MKSKVCFSVCIAFFAIAFVANFQWNMQDYGFRSASLSTQVLAQGSDDNWLDKVIGTVSDWWHDLKGYKAKKEHYGVTRYVVETTGSEVGGSVGAGVGVGVGGVGASASASVSAGSNSSKTIYYNEFLYECEEGDEVIFCTDEWLNSPNK